MKYLLFLSIVLMVGCKSQYTLQRENYLQTTKKYCGRYDTCVQVTKRMHLIYTDEIAFYIYKFDDAEISKNAYCYTKYVKESRCNSLQPVYVLYFTWIGTDELYYIKQDPVTGQILKLRNN